MKEIKGLLTKDLLQLKSYQKTLIVFILVFLGTAIAQSNAKGVSSMLIFMMTFGLGMFSMASFSYDEMAKADIYLLSMPLTRKDMVKEKYILSICAVIIGAIIGLVASLVGNIALSYIKPEFSGIEFNVMETLGLLVGSILGVGLMQCIQIPCVFKWGAEKGRIQILVIIGLLALIIGGAFMLIGKMDLAISPTQEIQNFVMTYLPVILLVVAVGIYYGSYRISLKIVKKKEM
jgi:hypothetical protein